VSTREFYVDPAAGSDTGTGTTAAPFKTIHKGVAAGLAARTAATNVVVNLLAGDHDASESTVMIEGDDTALNDCEDVWKASTFTLKGTADSRVVGGKAFSYVR
jgi:hypothetical protein